jgi:hypothetical protein
MTGWPEHDSKDRAVTKGQPVQDKYGRRAGTKQLEQDSLNRPTETAYTIKVTKS